MGAMLRFSDRTIPLMSLIVAMSTLLYCSEARAFHIQKTVFDYYLHWTTSEAHYVINPTGFPSGGVAGILNAFQSWNEVPNTSISFVYDGTTTKTGALDNENVIAFDFKFDPKPFE